MTAEYLYNIALSLPECVRILLVAPVFFVPYTFPRVKVLSSGTLLPACCFLLAASCIYARLSSPNGLSDCLTDCLTI